MNTNICIYLQNPNSITIVILIFYKYILNTYIIMDKNDAHKKENQSVCNKTQAQAIIECEAICKDILKCIHQPVIAPKVKKERELLEGVTEYFIFWN